MSFFIYLLIFALFLGVFGVQPTHEECKIERKKLERCNNNLATRISDIVDNKAFLPNRKSIEEVQTCVGVLHCDLTKSYMKFKSTEMEFAEKMNEIYSCTGSGVYTYISQECADITGVKDESCFKFGEFQDCIEKNIEKTPRCTKSDAEKFKTFSNLIGQMCQNNVELAKDIKAFNKANLVQ
ncbi:DUF19 domain-containing protein [Caenorhabditis elegans]|uniref:DUF19 domain-containing protein n=1 Tax=Caenorhabditis elegans TaxID=6239 RepID=Q7YTI6_CAEEL|nr:DUF19 domain-containing protein [Caenorhabditis elegans]CAE18024.1 DUF19 domain-containing protein [Caenorhabditis elegans]|eukprot:NP_001023525.1 Uncharacterized protein CELE_Y57G11C.41 [Caenorhabditis elegans]